MKESLDAEQNQQTHWQQNSLHSEDVTGNDSDGLLGGRIFVWKKLTLVLKFPLKKILLFKQVIDFLRC